jgi:hypothetical protein
MLCISYCYFLKIDVQQFTVIEKKAVLQYAMTRQDSTSKEIAVIVAISGAGEEPYCHPTEPQNNGRSS